jgi:TolB-like protein/tetratricopeptide (TPR) repeat protein
VTRAVAPEQIVYEFGDFRLDPSRQQLTCSGSVVPLKARAFDLLVYFAEHSGQLLDKAALMRAIWPNVVVEENNLSQHLSALRQALGDGIQGRQFIVTVPRRGYRFVADVRQVSGTKGTPTNVAASIPGPSVAVLPFANLSGDPEKEYFGDGMADELIHLLSRVPGLKVPARTSSFAYKGKNLHIRDIASELGVAFVLEGSVRSAGGLVRVTAQLIDAASGYHFWSQSYERQFRDIFMLQDEIASAILESLCSQMNVVLQPPAQRAPPTSDPAAYELYLQGLSMGYLMTAQSHQRALEMLRRATELDPQFAAAFAAIAMLRFYLSMWGLPDAIDEAERAAEAGLALDPASGEAHAALGLVSMRRGAWLRAEAHVRAAQELGHGSDMLNSHFAQLHLPASVGHIQSTVRHLREHYRAAPAVPYIPTLLAAASLTLPLAANATRQALDYAEFAVDLGMPRNAGPLPVVRAYAALRLGMRDCAMRAAQDLGDRLSAALAAAGGAEVIRLVHAALTLGANRSNAVQALNAFASAVTPQQIGPELNMHVLAWYTMLGELDRAYGFVERVLQQHLPQQTPSLFLPWIWLPELLPLRQDPRFQELVRHFRLIDYWRQYGPPDECDLRGDTLVCR